MIASLTTHRRSKVDVGYIGRAEDVVFRWFVLGGAGGAAQFLVQLLCAGRPCLSYHLHKGMALDIPCKGHGHAGIVRG